MNRREYLLSCLGEECAEIIKETSKANRFGLKNEHPWGGGTNEEKIQIEFSEAMAVMQMLIHEFFEEIDTKTLETVQKDKKLRIEKYMEYSKECGTLTES